MGGGVGDLYTEDIGTRWLIDTSFYIVVSVILLNIIFGIIIDTFSGLRSDKLVRLDDTKNICFICGIDRQTFDRASTEPDGFNHHVKNDHNLWNYLFFIFLIWEQDKDDDDGLELYVRNVVEASELYWFPINKAMCLDLGASEAEELTNEMMSLLNDSEIRIASELTHVRSEVKMVLDQFGKALNQDYGKGNAKIGISQFIQNMAAAQNHHNSKGQDRKSANGNVTDKSDNAVGGTVADRDTKKVSPGSHISVSLVDIINIGSLQRKDLETISCTIIPEGGMFTSVKSSSVTGSSVIFDREKKYQVCENCQNNDQRIVTLQVIQGDAKDLTATRKFLTTIEINAVDLLASNGKMVEKTFQVENSIATFRILPSCEEAPNLITVTKSDSDSDED